MAEHVTLEAPKKQWWPCMCHAGSTGAFGLFVFAFLILWWLYRNHTGYTGDSTCISRNCVCCDGCTVIFGDLCCASSTNAVVVQLIVSRDLEVLWVL